ncbi:putative sodium/calcium exchanger membrane region [Medicago truncatula]|uniref:Cation calcium exchanger n=1 Tax=Medicago truncatula TaxID=3880 RepID=A0A072U799_MEDTR|nr:cation/calcium exchanger 1 [Medicago truncatula]KEH25552.1 cation calcium exchanger [Medicago truncatula]RHN50745.1 putative sodium/calcium exchanger membrane region [Medicago truncatula]
MAPYTFTSNSKSQPKKLTLLLNTSFLFILFFSIKLYINPSNSNSHFHHVSSKLFNHARILTSDILVDSCSELHNYSNYTSKCIYVKTHSDCRSKGYINYLQIFYCNLGNSPILGHTLLVLWLVVLFYLLADTASNYFCTSLEGLSNILRLSPTIAGVTLLSLGNGAPDFFASVVSFTSSNNGAVGLNSILGGAFFVSTAVLGIISFIVSSNNVSVDKASFIRDVIFFLFSLFILLIIISIGKISLFGSICYLSIYFLYVCAVSATHFIYEVDKKEVESSSSCDDLVESGIPLLGYADDDTDHDNDSPQKPILQSIEVKEEKKEIFSTYYLWKFLEVLELPLCLPRKLTIPVVSEENWSKPYAVLSVTLAPILFAILCNTQMENVDPKSSLVAYLTSSLIGIVFGNMACVTTKSTRPPRRCLFPWLAGGFSMSVTWTYIIAEELVSLLISIGYVIGVSPSILGLTVLAWGNSLGDLIANGAMAKNGGVDGAQIAVSGCYAGPMFNILMGLGLPLVLSAWGEYPNSYVVPKDSSLLGTILFLMVGVLWSLVVLVKKNMRLDKFLGAGLLTIYLCFLFIRLAMAIGALN